MALEDVVIDIVTPSTTWTLAHNKNERPESVHFVIDDSPARTNWEHINLNTVNAYFPVAQAGTAILEFRRP